MAELLILTLMLLLLLLKGFFSGSEIALVNADKIKLHHRANQGHRGAQLVLKLFRRPEVLLGTTLSGNNISTVALTTLGTMLFIRRFGDFGEFIAFLILTPLLLILGEIVPKSVYQQNSISLAPIIIYPLRVFSFLFYPVVFVFSKLGRLAARIFGGGQSEQQLFITREQIRMVVEMSERGSNVGAFDRGRIRKAIRFAETTVGEAMIPLGEITALRRDASTSEAIALVRRRGYNRLPVYNQNINDIIGIATLTTWDLMDAELPGRPLSELVQPAHYVAPHQTIDQLLPVLQQRDDHMAIVVDEFGSAVGMITMEDILEEVVGEIDVGYDFEEYLPRRKRNYQQLGEETYLMDARLTISEVNELLGINLPATESHTIGGLVMARLRHIPKIGESMSEAGYRFTVEQASERAAKALRVEPEF